MEYLLCGICIACWLIFLCVAFLTYAKVIEVYFDEKEKRENKDKEKK